MLFGFIAGSVVFLLATAVGELSYLSLSRNRSSSAARRVTRVMKPELVTLPAFAARSRGLRGMSYRPGRNLVCALQVFGHLPGLCRHG